MADKSNDSEEDQIRVVDEDPAEVVRLDSAKVSPLEKKGKIANAVLAPVSGSDAEEQPSEKNSFDPEKEWLEDQNETGNETVPMGWFVLLAVGLLGIVGWVVFQTMMSDHENGSVNFSPPPQSSGGHGGRLKSAEADKAEIREAKIHFEKMEKVVSGFLRAETVEEMVQWVRHPERVKPLMKSYYGRNPFRPLTFRSTDEYHIASLENKPFLALKVRVREQEEGIPILLEDRLDGMLVDWESFVCFLPISPEDLVESRPTEALKLRVYAQRDTFYNYEFSDEDEYDCFRLHFRGSETTLYGFVKKGTSLEREFLKIFPIGDYKFTKPLIVRARFLEASETTNSILIEDLESTMWAFAEDPTNVDKKDSVD